MPSVEIIDYTGFGRPDEMWHAAHLMMFTKATRLQMDTSLFSRVANWSEAEKQAELDYMAKTIPSSWEFINVTFLLSNVTRACAQQITRTRTASYAMQSQRVTDMRAVSYSLGGAEGGPHENFMRLGYESSLHNYELAVDSGVALEDARGLLPVNVHCNLVAQYNLRTLADLFRKRESLRAQGEYVEIVKQMKALVLEVWPWSAPFFRPKLTVAAEIIEKVAAQLPTDLKRELAKAADLVKEA